MDDNNLSISVLTNLVKQGKVNPIDLNNETLVILIKKGDVDINRKICEKMADLFVVDLINKILMSMIR